MLVLHLTSLWSGKQFLAVSAFVFVMLCVAMSYAGWFDSIANSVHAGWILILLWNYMGMGAVAYKDNGKSEFFLAIGRIQKWCFAAIIAHFLLSLCFIAVWCVGLGILYEWCVLLSTTGIGMVLFSLVFALSALGNLWIKLIGQKPAIKLAIMTVVSAPWALAAWILGLFASQQALRGESAQMYLLMLGLFGIIQSILFVLSRNEAAQRRTKYQDKQ